MVMFVDGKYFTHYEGIVPEEMIESDIKQAKLKIKKEELIVLKNNLKKVFKKKPKWNALIKRIINSHQTNQKESQKEWKFERSC